MQFLLKRCFRTRMEIAAFYLQIIFLVPVIAGSLYGFLCVLALRRFLAECQVRDALHIPLQVWPPASVLKPVCGLDKGLEENLRSACLQDYPQYEVIISVQDPYDPAIEVIEKLRREFPDRVEIVIDNKNFGANGKVNNLAGALGRAKHEILVISDSDIRLKSNYLKNIIAALMAPGTPEKGYSCTLYKAVAADKWYEKLELLTFNADFVPGIIFSYVTGAAKFCLGSSVALRRSDLDGIGGIESLSGYLAEDYEMGRRLLKTGKKMVLVPYLVETLVDLKSPAQWWTSQVCWDQKTRSANPMGFFCTILVRSVPFAAAVAVLRLMDGPGLALLGVAVLFRIVSAAVILKWGMNDREGLQAIWLLPVRDLAALASWAVAMVRKVVVWRGCRLILNRSGTMARAQ